MKKGCPSRAKVTEREYWLYLKELCHHISIKTQTLGTKRHQMAVKTLKEGMNNTTREKRKIQKQAGMEKLELFCLKNC